jgi:hypothetical protein
MSTKNVKEKLIKKKIRREDRLKRFNQWRKQTESSSGCHNCYWVSKPWGQSPCKCCSRFDMKSSSDKFKRFK